MDTHDEFFRYYKLYIVDYTQTLPYDDITLNKVC